MPQFAGNGRKVEGYTVMNIHGKITDHGCYICGKTATTEYFGRCYCLPCVKNAVKCADLTKSAIADELGGMQLENDSGDMRV